MTLQEIDKVSRTDHLLAFVKCDNTFLMLVLTILPQIKYS